jgi:hypothetical protein
LETHRLFPRAEILADMFHLFHHLRFSII